MYKCQFRFVLTDPKERVKAYKTLKMKTGEKFQKIGSAVNFVDMIPKACTIKGGDVKLDCIKIKVVHYKCLILT